MPDLSVDSVGKVNGYWIPGHFHHITLGCKNENHVWKKVNFKGLHEFPGITHIVLPFKQLSQPWQFLFKVSIAFCPSFVAPMSGNSIFGSSVHFPGPDLDFQGLSLRPNHRCMKRLIHIWFGHCYIVFKPTGNRLPKGMNHPQSTIAVFDAVN